MRWDAEADQHLLLAILSAHRVTVDYVRVAKFVGCTPRACEERLKKLRRKAKDCGYDFFADPAPVRSRLRRKAKNPRADIQRVHIAENNTNIKPEKDAKDEGKYVSLVKRMKEEDADEMDDDIDEDAPLISRYEKVTVGPTTSIAAGFATTAVGVEIPLDVPLEVSAEPLMGVNGEFGEAVDLSSLKARNTREHLQPCELGEQMHAFPSGDARSLAAQHLGLHPRS